MPCLLKNLTSGLSAQKHSIYYWWSALLLLIFSIFSCLFLFAGYYLQSSHYHQDFIDQSVEKSKLLSLHLNREIEEQQAVIQYLAQDTDLLNAISMDDEQAILKWISAVHDFDHDQIYFIQSVKTNKIFSFGQTSKDVQEVLHHTNTSPNLAIYKSSSGQYLLCLTHALRIEGTIVGILGSIFSFTSFTNSIDLNRDQYSILIMEHGSFTDILSGGVISKPVTLLQNAMKGLSFSALFNHEQLAIPMGMNQLYLYAYTQRLTPNPSKTFLTWLLLCFPGCVLTYCLALRLSQKYMHSLIGLTAFSGDPKKDKKHLLALAESTSINEISDGANKLVQYCEQLMQSEEYKRHTALFEACTTALIVCDLEGRILEWNEELITLLGGTKKNLFDQQVKEIFASMDQLKVITGMAHVRQSITASLDTKNVFRARLRLNSARKRSQHVETVIKHLRCANKSSLVFMLYNVTKHVLAEQGLQRAKHSAETITKDRHHFYMGLTQEIEPLAESTSQALILLSETQPTNIQQRHMEQLQFHNELLSELITNIRDFALLETGSVYFERNTFELETLLRQVHASTYSRAMQLQSDICIYLDPTVPQEIWFDFSKSLQALSNIVNIAAKRVHGGIITLTVTAGEVLSQHMQIIFEVCGQKKSLNHDKTFEETGTLPQPEYYGEKGQQLSLAIVERMIKMFSIELTQHVTPADVHIFAFEVNLTNRIPLRDNLHSLLKGKTILLTYCSHNTINFIGKTLSRLGATCDFIPIEVGYCNQLIEKQHSYDVLISCDCAFESLPEKKLNNYFQSLTTSLYTVTHSYWEPTYSHSKIESFRKPVMVNELLARLNAQLLPRVEQYNVIESSLTPTLTLFIAKKTHRTNELEQQLQQQQYTVVQVDDIMKGVDARQLYQPELILLDTGNITLDSYWLIKKIREMEKQERLEPSRIVIFFSQEHVSHAEYIDPYTLTVNANIQPEKLIALLETLKNKANNSQVA
ncbi:PAS domain S-box protein [Halodesulfovibrio marinisediminis]|uniref:PAS domain S-box-containing protein n=1 Tax=Halodesulfovibrio marinisediminis DSM 17456 TaxID=1121457 RepID=A0A1N6JC33_9BACT|nr:PAS domain S-box protein [Halodesulfovibrio marinisediminis]SIO41783.1 PAS domain S-box-containing protein [Halodesulfovibrio marinisediminis DSM 17456]